MAKPKGMDAVIEKSSAAAKNRRKPVLKRKGPGIAIMIAVGKPKPGGKMGGMHEGMGEKTPVSGNPKERLAILEARIKELEAKLAEMEDAHGKMMGEDEGESEDEYEDED